MRKLALDCIAAAMLATLVLVAVGAAHDVDTFYTKKWKVGERNQNYGFGSNFPEGDFRTRVHDGAQEWNALAGNMQFNRGGVDVTWQYDSPCNDPGKNSIHWGSIDGKTPANGSSTVAITTTCYYTADLSKIALFRMKFDSAEDYYTGYGDTPSGKFDVKSFAAHEFGHATGFGRGGAKDHFDPSWDVCTNDPKHTMCPSIDAGKDYWRSLEEHDRHTFNNAYP
jgi:hypothetical protein